MNEIVLLKFLHLIAFVYWLGGDLGTYYASHFVVRDDLDNSARSTALDIMMGCDQAPRLCMPLIFAIGFHLAATMGLVSDAPVLVGGIWALALFWLVMVLAVHFGHGRAWIPRLQQFDFGFRLVVIAALTIAAILSFRSATPFAADWLALKVLIFAGLVFCGLMIRIRVAQFVPAWAELMQGNRSQDVNDRIRKSLTAARPWVWLIWAGLLVNAALGLHLF